jgi:hypothetical protein
MFIAKIDVDLLDYFRSLHADLDVLFSDINYHLLLKIRDKKLKFLIHLTYIITKCLLLCHGQVQSSGEVLYLWGNNYLTYKTYFPTFHPT